MDKQYLEILPEPEKIQVVVLMGGLGSRLGEQTKGCPKPLVDVGGRPFFDYQLDLLKGYGFRDFLFLVGHRAEMIEAHYGDGSQYGVRISYSYDGERLLGTGGAVCKAYGMLREDFLLLYGDSFMDIDYKETIYRYFKGKLSGCPALMTVLENRNRLDKSNVVMKEGKIILYDKRNRNGEMQYIDYGVGMFEKTLFQSVDADLPFDIGDIQKQLSIEGKLAAHEVVNRFYEIGSPKSLEGFRRYTEKRFGQRNKAVFFDRDGVVNKIVFRDNTEQLDSPLQKEELMLMEGAAEAMKELQEKGYYLFLVTNQPAAAKGKATLEDLYDINTCLCKMLAEKGIYVDGVEICPHYPKASEYTKEKFLIKDCRCRKPKIGMIESIMNRFSIDIEHSWMVGDSYTDVLAGRRAGLKTAFLGNFKCDVCKCLEYNWPDLVCNSLADLIYYEAGVGSPEET